MKNTFVAKKAITINAPASQVWDALTNPAMIKQYLFGTEAISDWKVGSPIVYKGTWEGKAYEDKGKILRVEPHKLLETTYWSGNSGLPDIPENYNTVTYELSANGNQTTVSLTQDNNASAEARDHAEQNWGMVLDGMKKLLEK
jgi:uncharacterized protein YndB with AHSA1/START domain